MLAEKAKHADGASFLLLKECLDNYQMAPARSNSGCSALLVRVSWRFAFITINPHPPASGTIFNKCHCTLSEQSHRGPTFISYFNLALFSILTSIPHRYSEACSLLAAYPRTHSHQSAKVLSDASYAIREQIGLVRRWFIRLRTPATTFSPLNG